MSRKAETGAQLPKEAVPEGHDGGTLAKETEPTQMGVPPDIIKVGGLCEDTFVEFAMGRAQGPSDSRNTNEV